MSYLLDVYQKMQSGSPKPLGKIEFEVSPKTGDVIALNGSLARVVECHHQVKVYSGQVRRAECIVVVE